MRRRRRSAAFRPGGDPYVIALLNGRGFVTNQYANSVTAFDLKTLKPIDEIDVGDHPEGIAADPATGRLYVADWGDNRLSVIDASTLKQPRPRHRQRPKGVRRLPTLAALLQLRRHCERQRSNQ